MTGSIWDNDDESIVNNEVSATSIETIRKTRSENPKPTAEVIRLLVKKLHFKFN